MGIGNVYLLCNDIREACAERLRTGERP